MLESIVVDKFISEEIYGKIFWSNSCGSFLLKLPEFDL